MMSITTELDPSAEAEILIEKFLSKEIEEKEGERLLAFLQEHPDWEQEIFDQHHIVNLLKEIRELEESSQDWSHDAFKSELLGELLNFYEKVSVYSRNMRRRRLRQRLLLGGMMTLSFFLFVIVVHAYWNGSQSGDYVSKIKVSLPAPPTSDAVAVLSRAIDVQWSESTSLRAESGTVLSPGRLTFESGVILIHFYNGARFVVEGPADLEIRSISDVFCKRGRFSVELPERHNGFTLNSRVFGEVSGEKYLLQINPKTVELHCIQGTVSFQPRTDEGERNTQKLHEGKGYRRDEKGSFETIAADATQFTSIDNIEKRSKEKASEQFAVWCQSRKTLANDPSLVLFFDFQHGNYPSSDRISNRSSHSAAPREGILVGGGSGVGRWPEKDSLEFRVVSDRLLVSISDRLKSVTLSVSLRADDIGRNLNSIFLTERFENGPLHWQILNNIEGGERGAIRLGLKHPAENVFKATNFDSPVVFDENRIGVWTRLAVVVDADEKVITHYMNGRVLSRHDLPFEVDFNLARSEIGNWTSITTTNPIRNFIGGFEEFLLFSRALSDAEVEQLHCVE